MSEDEDRLEPPFTGNLSEFEYLRKHGSFEQLERYAAEMREMADCSTQSSRTKVIYKECPNCNCDRCSPIFSLGR